MGKKVNKKKKQLQALQRLRDARERGIDDLAIEAVLGNQYSRQVAKNYLLEDGVEAFDFTSEEAEVCRVLDLSLSERPGERDYYVKRLKSREWTLAYYFRHVRIGDDISAMMDALVEDALAAGQITKGQYLEIQASKKER